MLQTGKRRCLHQSESLTWTTLLRTLWMEIYWWELMLGGGSTSTTYGFNLPRQVLRYADGRTQHLSISASGGPDADIHWPPDSPVLTFLHSTRPGEHAGSVC
jgi:hypothetical protein